MSDRVTTYSAGQWVAISSEDGWLLADLDPADMTVLVCWGLLRTGAGLDAVLDAMLAKGLRSVRGFALARANPDGSASVVVRGTGRVAVSRGGDVERISGQDVATWRETAVPGGWSALDLELDGEQTPDGEQGEHRPLSAGVTLAGAIRVADRARDEREQPAHPDQPRQQQDQRPSSLEAVPVPVPVPTQAMSIQDLEAEMSGEDEPSAPVQLTKDDSDALSSRRGAHSYDEAHGPAGAGAVAGAGAGADAGVAAYGRPPAAPGDAPVEASVESPRAEPEAPMVDTVRCERGHLNPLTVGVCRVCGIALQPQVPARLPRPQLGVLRMSTGDEIPLDRDVIFGRSPNAEAAGLPGEARLVTVDSPNQDTSRTHCAIHLEGWTVLIADLNSTNGTVVTRPWQEPVRLTPNQPVAIEPGTVVAIANEVTFRYEPVG
jgi:hypothetical protein